VTRLWPAGEPVQVTAGPDGLPRAFLRRGTWHTVDHIANRWRVRASWWSVEAWREYVRLTTTDGLLCTLYCDLRTRAWFCSRLFD
jgi:hypothetical protein